MSRTVTTIGQHVAAITGFAPATTQWIHALLGTKAKLGPTRSE